MLPIIKWKRYRIARGDSGYYRKESDIGDELISDCGRLRIKILNPMQHELSVWSTKPGRFGNDVTCYHTERIEYITLNDMKELARYTYKLILAGHYNAQKRTIT